MPDFLVYFEKEQINKNKFLFIKKLVMQIIEIGFSDQSVRKNRINVDFSHCVRKLHFFRFLAY